MDITLRVAQRNFALTGNSSPLTRAYLRAGKVRTLYSQPIGPPSILEVQCASCHKKGILYSACTFCHSCRQRNHIDETDIDNFYTPRAPYTSVNHYSQIYKSYMNGFYSCPCRSEDY